MGWRCEVRWGIEEVGGWGGVAMVMVGKGGGKEAMWRTGCILSCHADVYHP